MARSRSTKPMWAAGRLALRGGKQTRNRLSRLPPKSGVGAPVVSAWRVSRTHPPRASFLSSKRLCAREQRFEPMAGEPTTVSRGVGFEHQPKNISASGDPAHIVMPQVHRVAGLLDRWWLGIHHGAISASQLDYYLDEFTFRFNRRRSKARGLLFYRLLQQAVQLEPVPYKKLVGGRPSPAPQI